MGNIPSDAPDNSEIPASTTPMLTTKKASSADVVSTTLGTALPGDSSERREEEVLLATVLQAGCGQMIATMQAFCDSCGLQGHHALSKLLDALSEYVDDFRLSGTSVGPENDFVRLGAGRVFIDLFELVSGREDSGRGTGQADEFGNDSDGATKSLYNPLSDAVLTAPECIELISTAMRAISSISKIPGQAISLIHDGVLSSMSKVLQTYSKLPPKKSEKVVWWTINAFFFLLFYGEKNALICAMEDEALIHVLQTLANHPWNTNKSLAVHVSLVTSKLAAGFHAESVALQKNLLV